MSQIGMCWLLCFLSYLLICLFLDLSVFLYHAANKESAHFFVYSLHTRSCICLYYCIMLLINRVLIALLIVFLSYMFVSLCVYAFVSCIC